MKLFHFLNLKGIGGQIAALVVASIIALHLIITASFMIIRPDRSDTFGLDGQFELVQAAHLLAAAPATARERLIADIDRAYPRLGLQAGASETASDNDYPHLPLHELIRHLGSGYRLVALASNDQRIGIVLPDGAMISAKVAMPRHRLPFFAGPWIMTILFGVISVTLLGLWAARALAAPLSSFAKAAENFSLDSGAEPLPERGPAEVRAVARALNRMRERIVGLIDDRTKMLAALSHDLRTPITRLRLRSEFVEDETHRSRMLADLDQMRAMLEAVLSLLRNSHQPEAMTLTDVASSVQIVSDQFSDLGHKVAYVGPDHAMATVSPNDLHRCVTNLVDNAVRFGTEVRISLAMRESDLAIEIEDNGPGIPDSLKETVLQPFVRGDSARNMDDAAGFGLGLSIANAVVVAHGGKLTLHDRAPQGLRVRIQLPIARPSQRLRA